MPNKPLTVADNVVVSMDYTLTLKNGEVVDSSAGGEALQFIQGQGHIIPGLERALYGMGEGDEKEVVVAPIDGYGLKNPNAFQSIPRNSFPKKLELTKGMALRVEDKEGSDRVAYIDEIRSDEVRLNLNHPLAGETLNFQVKIAALRPATAQELSHGHVHSAGHNH